MSTDRVWETCCAELAGQTYWRCRAVECTIELWPRPSYCDRGRWQAHIIDRGFPVNPNPFDAQDGFPRYYFDLERAKDEMEALLQFRKYTVLPAKEST